MPQFMGLNMKIFQKIPNNSFLQSAIILGAKLNNIPRTYLFQICHNSWGRKRKYLENSFLQSTIIIGANIKNI